MRLILNLVNAIRRSLSRDRILIIYGDSCEATAERVRLKLAAKRIDVIPFSDVGRVDIDDSLLQYQHVFYIGRRPEPKVVKSLLAVRSRHVSRIDATLSEEEIAVEIKKSVKSVGCGGMMGMVLCCLVIPREEQWASYLACRSDRGNEICSSFFTGRQYKDTQLEDVGVVAVAPAIVCSGGDAMLQIAGALQRALENAVKEAEEDDRENGARRRGKLLLRVAREQKIAFEFVAKRGIVPEEDRQEIQWDGNTFNVRFMLHVADNCETGAIPCRVNVFVDGVAVGRIAFMTNVVAKSGQVPSQEQRYAETTASPARNFFISYADKDYDAVLNYVEGIRVGSGGHMFFDKLSLERGDEWWSRICDYIDRKAEVFVLFWSENAAKSEYVRKEYLRALDNRAKRAEATTGGEFSRPEICPIVLSRPFPPPPAELEAYNFTDKLTFMKG